MNLIRHSINTLRQRFSQNGTEYDTERGQAISRIIIVPIGYAYMLTALVSSGREVTLVIYAMVIYSTFYIPGSWGLLYSIIKNPGYRFYRRVFAIANDYLAMTFALAVGGQSTTPVFALVLWVTVGNGLRYGSKYLIAATCCALASIAVTVVFNPYWQSNLSMVLTLVITTVLIPAYIYGLLQRLQNAYNTALDANLAKSRLLAQASHDLRQPIHAISLFTTCLRDTHLNNEQSLMVDNIDRSLHSVSGLFRSLLDISTLESGRVQPHFRSISVDALIEDLVQQNREAAKWVGVELRYVPSHRYVSTDPTLIATILQNVVSNAIKHASGRPILIGCRRRSGRISLEVHDQGEGIAAHHLPRIFDEFYQARERGDKDVEGVGLGLAIVKRLAELLGLQINIQSLRGRGTSVAIDGLKQVNPETQAATRLPYDSANISIMGGLRVLLVEDDKDVLLATATLLEKWGCVVQREETLPTSVAECHLIITDFDLGANVTGSDVLASVRQSLGRDVPAIVITGHDETRIRDERIGRDIPILSKPVSPSELRSVVMLQKIKIERLKKATNKVVQ